MQLLQDVGTSRCRLVESVNIDKESLPKGVLGVMEGVCSDYTQATRNENFYSRALWERILDSDYVKECLETKTLFGALDHPETLENLAGDAAVSCTKLWLDDNEQCLKGQFNVLPTPRGKILDALLKTGAVMGVSCRGVGDLTPQADGTNKVEEDTYNFVCFDVVTQPAAAKARQKYQKLTESQKLKVKPVLDALVESVTPCKSQEEIDSIVSLAKRLGYDEANEFITKVTEQQEIINNTPNNEDDEKLKEEIKVLNTLNERLKQDLETAYKKIKVMESSMDRTTLAADISYLRTQISKLNKNIDTNNSQIIEKCDQILSHNSKIIENNTIADDRSELKEKIEYWKNKATLEESKNKQLNAKLNYAVDFVNKCKTSMETLKSTNSELQSKLTESQNNIDNLKLASAKLIKQKNTAEAKLEESSKLLKDKTRLVEELKKEYLLNKEKTFGVKSSINDDTLNKVASLKEIDRLVVESNKVNNYKGESNVMAARRVPLDEIEAGSSTLATIMGSFNKKK